MTPPPNHPEDKKIKFEDTSTKIYDDTAKMPLDKLNGVKLPASADFHGG